VKKVRFANKWVPLTAERLSQWAEAIITCAPNGCEPLLKAVVEQVFHSDSEGDVDSFSPVGLNAVLRLLEGLAPLVSVEAMLPRVAVPFLRRMLAYADSWLGGKSLARPGDYEQDQLRRASPEISEVVTEVLYGVASTAYTPASMYTPLRSFLLALCDAVDATARSDVAPPPFEPQTGTYNPPGSGIALQFSPHGERGRYTRQYEETGKRDERGTCQKDFGGPSRKRTGGIFSFFCPHGYSYGSTIILDHEGRRDPFQCLYTHMPSAPAVIIYDFACSLSEYCLNRESSFFANTRYAWVQICVPIILPR
jgi:hypothetical protein